MLRLLKEVVKAIPGAKWLLRKYIYYKKYAEGYRHNIAPIKTFMKSHKKGVFLLLTPEHGNLGDHAIALSEIEFLKKVDIEYCEISEKRLFYLESLNKLSLLNGYPLLITGGGFLGTLWYNDERLVRNIIIANPDSEILIFPSSIVYEDSDFGNEEYKKAKQIYSGHRKLKLYTREWQSYESSKNMCTSVQIAPDMVMHMRRDEDIYVRHGCLLCFRRDIERTINELESVFIRERAEELFDQVGTIDTVRMHTVPIEQREQEVEQLLDIIKKAELVVTDRLHGMIFSAITGTPCIVFNSRSPKVLGCYEWLKNLEYIQICHNIEEFSGIYERMPRGSQKYDNTKLIPLYDKLIKDIICMKQQ